MAGEPTVGVLSGYDPGGYYCEMTGGGGGTATHTAPIRGRLATLRVEDLRRRARDAARELFSLGITFTVYSQNDAIDRILPFDVIPRVLSRDEWARIESGVVQRVTAINLFLHDIYHDQNILGDGCTAGMPLLDRGPAIRAALLTGAAQQHDADAPVARRGGIVGKQVLAIGLADDLGDPLRRQTELDQHAPAGIGAVGRQLPVSIAIGARIRSRVGMPGDADVVG